jgi:uncharacterized membrane protein HdeD (DUF308 family)
MGKIGAALMQLLGAIFALGGLVVLVADPTTGVIMLLAGIAMLFYGTARCHWE